MGSVFSYEDYPPEALKKKKQGTVRAKLWFSKQGTVYACRIVQSSGNEALDKATCNILNARTRFTPALNDFGNPIDDIYLAPPVKWVIQR